MTLRTLAAVSAMTTVEEYEKDWLLQMTISYGQVIADAVAKALALYVILRSSFECLHRISLRIGAAVIVYRMGSSLMVRHLVALVKMPLVTMIIG